MNPIHAIFSSKFSTLIAFLGPEFSTPTPKQNCNFGTLFFSGLSKSTYVIHLLPLARQQCQQIIRNQLIRNHEHIANITYSPSIIYSLGPETKLGIPTLVLTVGGGGDLATRLTGACHYQQIRSPKGPSLSEKPCQ